MITLDRVQRAQIAVELRMQSEIVLLYADYKLVQREAAALMQNYYRAYKAGVITRPMFDNAEAIIHSYVAEHTRAFQPSIAAIMSGIRLVNLQDDEPLPDVPAPSDPLFGFWLHARNIATNPISERRTCPTK